MQKMQGTPVVERSKFVFFSVWFSFGIAFIFGGGFIVFGILIYCLPEALPEFIEFAPFSIAAGALLLVYFVASSIPVFVIALMCPKTPVTIEGNIFNCYCGRKLGCVQIPAGEITSVTTTGGIWYSNVIMLARGKYDGSLVISTLAGQSYKVPCVRDVKKASADIQTMRARVDLAEQSIFPPSDLPQA